MAIEDVETPGGVRLGPANLAAKIAKLATRKNNPIRDVIVVFRYADGSVNCSWTMQDTTELSELALYFDTEVREVLWSQWRGITGEELEDGGEE